VKNESSKWACYFHFKQIEIVDKKLAATVITSSASKKEEVVVKQQQPLQAAPSTSSVVVPSTPYQPSDDLHVVVIDGGSGFTKVGFAGNDSPSVSFRSVIGQIKYVNVMPGTNTKDTFVGSEGKRREIAKGR
jgi:hypothetical protein